MHYSDCDYILVDRRGDPWPLDSDALNATIDHLLAQPERYQVMEESDGIILFQNAQLQKKSDAPAWTQGAE